MLLADHLRAQISEKEEELQVLDSKLDDVEFPELTPAIKKALR